MKLNYKKYGNYYLPELILTEKENKPLNKYGLLKLEYIKRHNKGLYQELLMKDQLTEYLFSVSSEAEDKVNYLTNKLIESDNTITEELKATNQLLWLQKMNSCKLMAEEIVLKELIYN